MKLRELSVWGVSLVVAMAVLGSGCSEERKREAAKLENQLHSDSGQAAVDVKPVDSASAPRQAAIPADSARANGADPGSAKVPVDSQPTQAVVPKAVEAADTGRSAVTRPATEPVADVNAVPDEKGVAREATRPQAAMPPQPHDGFTIQIMSTSSKAEADQTSENFTNAGYQAYVSEVTMDGKTRYRVRIGFYPTESEARQALGKLKEEQRVDGWIGPVAK